jgi:hypothetical protein
MTGMFILVQSQENITGPKRHKKKTFNVKKAYFPLSESLDAAVKSFYLL